MSWGDETPSIHESNGFDDASAKLIVARGDAPNLINAPSSDAP